MICTVFPCFHDEFYIKRPVTIETCFMANIDLASSKIIYYCGFNTCKFQKVCLDIIFFLELLIC